MGVVRAVDGVDLDVYENEALGLVGETGCGKSVTSLSILRLIDYPGKIVGGEIWFRDQDLLKISDEEMRKIRGSQISAVFQDPTTHLNPVLTIGDQISEAITAHQAGSKRGIRKVRIGRRSKSSLKEDVTKRAIELLRWVRMPDPEGIVDRYPHELSGGMKQRVMIAIALASNPKLIIADEATSNLDVTIQDQVLRLIDGLKKQLGLSFLVITHNLGVVAEICDKVAVMYTGKVVEYADIITLFDNPRHPYTIGLLESTPKPHINTEMLRTIPGSLPNPIYPPPGCRFHPRCVYAEEACKREEPKPIDVGDGHLVACHLCSRA